VKTKKIKDKLNCKHTSLYGRFIIAVTITFGAVGATNMSGKLAGHVFSRNRGGSYIRTKVKPLNPQSARQTVVRNEFGVQSGNWRGLTAAQRLQWNSATVQFLRKNSLGSTITLSGINLYKALNQALFNIGQALISSPPVPQSAVNVNSLSVAVSATGSTMVATFAATPTPANMYIEVYATPPLSPGITFIKNRLRVIQVLPPATATGVSLQAAYVAKFGATIVGQKIGFVFQSVNGLTGERSPIVQSESIAV